MIRYVIAEAIEHGWCDEVVCETCVSITEGSDK